MGQAIHTAWRDYRRRWWITAAFLLTFLPVAGTVAILLKKLTGSDAPGMIIAFAWMTAYALAGQRVASFPCPSCGQQFFCRERSPWWKLMGRRIDPVAIWDLYNPFAKRCVHCGLPKWHAPP